MTPPCSVKFLLRAIVISMLAVTLAVATPAAQEQQSGTTQYTYDKNGRLVKVVLPSGDLVTYEYDQAGNITAIRSICNLTLRSFSPQQGAQLDLVTFIGTCFGEGIAANTVSFNGVNARVVSASITQIVAEVPQNATTGIVTIITPNGTVMTDGPFTIVNAGVVISPKMVTLLTGQSKMFTVSVNGVADKTVQWSVNGIAGGNTVVGLISTNGLYAAPNTVPATNPVTIRATSVANSTFFDEAQVTVREIVNLSPLASVSVSNGTLPNFAKVLSTSVSISNGALPSENRIAVSNPVSVVSGVVPETRSALSSAVSVTNGPIISAISPSGIAAGATVTITITGNNLNGTTTLNFIRENTGQIDTGITASGITSSADGTSLTATISVSSGSTTGTRIVVVSTPKGNSSVSNLGVNTITINP
jgi:YD repeat-containing protein